MRANVLPHAPLLADLAVHKRADADSARPSIAKCCESATSSCQPLNKVLQRLSVRVLLVYQTSCRVRCLACLLCEYQSCCRSPSRSRASLHSRGLVQYAKFSRSVASHARSCASHARSVRPTPSVTHRGLSGTAARCRAPVVRALPPFPRRLTRFCVRARAPDRRRAICQPKP